MTLEKQGYPLYDIAAGGTIQSGDPRQGNGCLGDLRRRPETLQPVRTSSVHWPPSGVPLPLLSLVYSRPQFSWHLQITLYLLVQVLGFPLLDSAICIWFQVPVLILPPKSGVVGCTTASTKRSKSGKSGLFQCHRYFKWYEGRKVLPGHQTHLPHLRDDKPKTQSGSVNSPLAQG